MKKIEQEINADDLIYKTGDKKIVKHMISKIETIRPIGREIYNKSKKFSKSTKPKNRNKK